MARLRSALAGIPIGRAMITEVRTLDPSDSLDRAVESILAGHQQDFPVTEGGHLVGVLGRSDLLMALARHGPEARVRAVMRRRFETADLREMLEGVFARLQSCRRASLPVVEDGRLVGLVTMDNLVELLLVQEDLREAGERQHRIPSRNIRRGPSLIGRIENGERVCP